MGISVEKAVVENLFQIGQHQFAADIIQIIAQQVQLFPIGDFGAFDVLFHQYPARRKPWINLRNADASDSGIEVPKALQQLGFVAEIQFDQSVRFHLLQSFFRIDHLNQFLRDLSAEPDQDVQIADQEIIDDRALHFHDHFFPCTQNRPMDLRNRGTGERFFIDGQESFA
ncbi:hypothetical protein SDC9_123411 [bioreactor metagenome]|uniref:Uncharacterized protein n=1 Tax=bioreactor metagenome TaxID=1076179 RepID=A0A645CHJ0_9ZZZZ